MKTKRNPARSTKARRRTSRSGSVVRLASAPRRAPSTAGSASPAAPAPAPLTKRKVPDLRSRAKTKLAQRPQKSSARGAKRAKLVGTRLAAYVSSRGQAAFGALLNQVRTSRCSARAELELVRNKQPWLARITVAVLPRGETTLLIAFDDVTEARRKDEFLAMLSHELRNPLAPIVTCISALRMIEPGSGSAKRMLDMIERSANHLTRLVDDLLDVTRITSGKIQLQREPVELVGLVSGALADTRPAFERRNLQLEARIPGSELSPPTPQPPPCAAGS